MTRDEALGKYIAGKERLQILLNERDALLAGLDSFSWIQGLSTPAFVVDLDMAGLRDLVQQLANLTTNIDDLVTEMNDEAKCCGQLRVGVKIAERVEDGALRLTRPHGEPGALRE